MEHVRTGDWDPDRNDGDRQNRNALAARGYRQVGRLVRSAVAKAVGGENAAALLRETHQTRYRERFQPTVAAGLIPASALAGYRNNAVFLRGSRHVPPRWEAVRDAMTVLFDLLERDVESGVRAVLGHWLFGCVRPYRDGNGRLARLAMHTMLASGGFPWIVIRVEDRRPDLAALEAASADQDIGPFARFPGKRVEAALDRAAGLGSGNSAGPIRPT